MRAIPSLVIGSALLALCSCGGSSPSTPTGPSPTVTGTSPTPPAMTMISGAVTATNGNQPIGGLSVSASTSTVTTDAQGRFVFPVSGSGTGGSFPITITGAPIVRRKTNLALSTHGVIGLGVFNVAQGFDINYFRQLAHGAYDRPVLRPIQRWTRNPSVHIQTLDFAGHAIDPQAIVLARSAITDTIGAFTGGQLGVAAFEQGTASRAGQPGWLTVIWGGETSELCGSATVGFEGGTIEIDTLTPGCRCAGLAIDPAVVRHELGHSMGMWHTDRREDLMYPQRSGSCGFVPSAREREYAAYVYARPVGNTDPDDDPSSTIFAKPERIK